MEKPSINKYIDDEDTIYTIQKDAPDNLFISRISYEPRTLGILRKLNNNYKSDIGLFITNEKFQNFSKVDENRKKIESILKESHFFGDYEFITASIDNPITIIMEIDKIIKNSFKDKQKINITFDITTFPRGELLTVIYYLRHLAIIDILRILYVSPNKYGKWLTNGFRYSMIPPFFEGPATFGKKRALFILTGFEYDRAISLIDDIQPSFLILGKPFPGTSDEFDNISDQIVNQLKSTRQTAKEVYEIPANDPFKCLHVFRNIIQENSHKYDFFVAPMGPKLQLLGIYLAYEEKLDFRIVYPVPLIYNVGDYSSGCKNVYEILLKNSENIKK